MGIQRKGSGLWSFNTKDRDYGNLKHKGSGLYVSKTRTPCSDNIRQ